MKDDRISVDMLSFGVHDMKPIDTEWDSERLLNDEWQFWDAEDHTLESGRDLVLIIRSASSIVAAFTDDGTRIDMKYGTVEVDDIECQNCDGSGEADTKHGTSLCLECDATGNIAKLTDDEITELNNLDAFEFTSEGPMMNYRYPLGDSEDHIGGYQNHTDAVGAAHRLRALPLCVTEYDDDICLALTGGGMDLTWEIVEAFTLLGYLPPVHFCNLPGMADRGRERGYNKERDIYIIDAVDRSLREQVKHIQYQLDRHREKYGITNGDSNANQ